MSNLKTYYQEQVVQKLKQDLGYKSVMEVPRITKITLNMGVGEAAQDKKALNGAVEDLTKITGQKPSIALTYFKTCYCFARQSDRGFLTKITGQKPSIALARKSVAGFKIRQGWPIGCKVTLRGNRMYEFLERLIDISIPRIRDFRGLNPKSFDGRGNYSMGLREQIVFPEIDYDKIDKLRGLDITITTSAKTDDEGRALLTAFNFPLKK